MRQSNERCPFAQDRERRTTLTPKKTPARKPAAKKTTAKKVTPKKPAAKKAEAKRAASAADPILLKRILTSLDDDKAEQIVTIDLEGRSSLCDAIVVASGRSSRHVSSIAEHLARRLKEAGYGTRPMNGQGQGDWALVDAGDVIVHVFRPEVRSYYDLEGMWSVEEPKRARARGATATREYPMRLTVLAVGHARGTAEGMLTEDFIHRASQLGRNMGISAVTVEEVSVSKTRDARTRMS